MKEKILAEIERLANFANGYYTAFINSIPEEPVSNSDWLAELQDKLDKATPEQLEELWNKYHDEDEEEPVSEDLKKEIESYCFKHGYISESVFGYTIQEQVGDIAKHFYDIGRLHQEPVSEGLDKAANDYGLMVRKGYPRVMDETDRLIRDAFKAGAEWQKEKDINDACSWIKDELEGYDVYASDVEHSCERFKEYMKYGC